MAYQDSQIDEDRLRQEIKKELEHDFKKRYKPQKKNTGLRSCCGCLLAILIVVGIGAAFFLKTGRVTIPFVGDIWHKENVPLRWVDMGEGGPLELGEILEPKIEEAVGRKVSGLHDIVGLFSNKESALIDLELTESELSRMLSGLIEEDLDQGEGSSGITYVQVAMEEGFMELFVTLEDPVQMNIRARLVPHIGEEGLKVEVEELILGRLAVPPVIRQGLYDKLIAPEVSILNRTFEDVFPTQIALLKGSVALREIDLLGLVRFSQDDSPKAESWIDSENIDFDKIFNQQ